MSLDRLTRSISWVRCLVQGYLSALSRQMLPRTAESGQIRELRFTMQGHYASTILHSQRWSPSRFPECDPRVRMHSISTFGEVDWVMGRVGGAKLLSDNAKTLPKQSGSTPVRGRVDRHWLNRTIHYIFSNREVRSQSWCDCLRCHNGQSISNCSRHCHGAAGTGKLTAIYPRQQPS